MCDRITQVRERLVQLRKTIFSLIKVHLFDYPCLRSQLVLHSAHSRRVYANLAHFPHIVRYPSRRRECTSVKGRLARDRNTRREVVVLFVTRASRELPSKVRNRERRERGNRNDSRWRRLSSRRNRRASIEANFLSCLPAEIRGFNRARQTRKQLEG